MFVMAAVGMQAALSQVAASTGGMTQSLMLFSAYSDVVSAPPDLPVAEPPRQVPGLREGITLEDVWFRYDESHPWVFQDYLAYELTVSENIGVGDLSVLDDPEAIQRAAEKAGADRDIATLPDKYDTMLSRIFFVATQKARLRQEYCYLEVSVSA